MDVDTLNLAEQRLRFEVQRTSGLMEEMHDRLQQTGVFREYEKIYETYVEPIELGNEELEDQMRNYWRSVIENEVHRWV